MTELERRVERLETLMAQRTVTTLTGKQRRFVCSECFKQDEQTMFGDGWSAIPQHWRMRIAESTGQVSYLCPSCRRAWGLAQLERFNLADDV